MKGRIWLILGAVLGVAIGFGHVPYLAGAAKELADTAQQLVNSGGHHLISAVASEGASRRVVLGITAAITVLAPGITALLLVIAARSSLRLRVLIGLLLMLVGAATFAYRPHGVAAGALVLAVAVAGVAVVAIGPLVASPLTALAALIGCEFLPRLVAAHSSLPNLPVQQLHEALANSPGSPLDLRIIVLVVAAIPFAWALRLILR